jgi:hypothetical protein
MFCGGPADSKEHAFPDWLNTVFPIDEVGPTSAELFRATPANSELYSWPASRVASESIREVCRSCNNNWMSELESRAKPLLVPMATGIPQLLEQSQQIVVATWGAKTVMVCERVVGRNFNFAESDRRIVMEQDRPPAHVSVYAAAIETNVGPLRFAHAAGEILSDGIPTAISLHFYTLQVGVLVLQLLRADPPADVGKLWESFPPERDVELPLWPPMASDFYWPTKTALDEAGFMAYTHRMTASGRPPLLPPGSRFAVGQS